MTSSLQPSSAGNGAARDAIVGAIDAAAADLIRLSKFIHANPEIALQEVQASAVCADFLEARGFTVERGIAELPTAFRATVGEQRPCVAYLAEYDALPQVGHGCGHNLIAMANIAAGIGLAAALPSLDGPGMVAVFGTPAEESIGGKAIMAEAGAFAAVDAAFGAHPAADWASVPVTEGSGHFLARQDVHIAFHGQAAHSAGDPENGINALDAVIETFNGINALRQHIASHARIHGYISHGGDATNVIPAYATAELGIREATKEKTDELVQKVRRIAEGAALMTGARLEFERVGPMILDTRPNHTLARASKRYIEELGMPLPDSAAGFVIPASTDWGNVNHIVPSFEASFPIIKGYCIWHSQEVVDAADTDLAYANTLTIAKVIALTGYEVLAEKSLLDTARAEFTQAAGG